jgi:hypothetical protein
VENILSHKFANQCLFQVSNVMPYELAFRCNPQSFDCQSRDSWNSRNVSCIGIVGRIQLLQGEGGGGSWNSWNTLHHPQGWNLLEALSPSFLKVPPWRNKVRNKSLNAPVQLFQLSCVCVSFSNLSNLSGCVCVYSVCVCVCTVCVLLFTATLHCYSSLLLLTVPNLYCSY